MRVPSTRGGIGRPDPRARRSAGAWLAFAALVLGSIAHAATPVSVEFRTSLGRFTVVTEPDRAPETVANFLRYVDGRFYDGLIFHRVIPGFVIQAGGYDENFEPRETEPPIRNESKGGLANTAGTLSMARTSDPDSADSQFFVNLVDNPSLDASRTKFGYAVFARVTDGHETVDRIAAVETGNVGAFRDVPLDPVVILSARRAGVSIGGD